MRAEENYTRFIAVSLMLILAILASFQLYILREPARIAAAEAKYSEAAIHEGSVLFADNCTMCHGADGEGVDGPPLNDSTFLAETAENTIFSLISSGVPGTEMPAWNQAHGGPFTDEQVGDVVAFIRAWEPNAPDRHALAMAGNPIEGLELYESTCIVCHGENGAGTENAPQLNNPERLSSFDDEWYVDTIREGRPAEGMPTWGTVLSPVEIRDLVALLRTWQRGETVEPITVEEALAEAMHMLDHGDWHATEHALEQAMRTASGEALPLIQEALVAVDDEDFRAADKALSELQKLLDIHVESHED